MVESHGGITLATLRDVNLDKRCVALPRYIVYVYMLYYVMLCYVMLCYVMLCLLCCVAKYSIAYG